MRGVGEATAAITIVNALPTGFGAAAGIELRTQAEVTFREATNGSLPPMVIRPDRAATPLVRAALADALERFPAPDRVPVELSLRSEIPMAAGLKSSSAVTSAIVLAVAHATGRNPAPPEVAGATASIGRAAGVSATGAYDDALAGLVGGAVVTDNRHDRLLAAFPLDPDLAVALWIPPGTHPSAPDARSRFPPESPRTRAPVDAARAGHLWQALELNSDLVEEAMGYPYRGLRERLRGIGAVACGASGLGPALAAVAPRTKLPILLAELSGRPGRCCSVDFSHEPAPEAIP
ncbi:MAG: shikimate kinase [Thermoplasmata archaeon]